MLYKHTQLSIVILSVFGVIILLIGILWLNTAAKSWILGLALLGLFVIAVLFATLTVEVNRDVIECKFSIGLITKKIAVTEIVEVSTVKNPWFYGWGIKLTPRGWMFNVSGLDAVEITFKNGKHFRIGTDQPQQLKEAILQALNRN